MYRDSIKFITKIDKSKMPASLVGSWENLSELDRLMLIKSANRDLLQEALDKLNEHHSWAFVEMEKK